MQALSPKPSGHEKERWTRYVTFTFQKMGAPNLRISPTFFRHAVG